jgi:hypothetical protein
MMARSRIPLVVEMSGTFRSAWACRRVRHLPDLTPIRLRALHSVDAGVLRIADTLLTP